jgi:hypothetical protein
MRPLVLDPECLPLTRGQKKHFPFLPREVRDEGECWYERWSGFDPSWERRSYTRTDLLKYMSVRMVSTCLRLNKPGAGKGNASESLML